MLFMNIDRNLSRTRYLLVVRGVCLNQTILSAEFNGKELSHIKISSRKRSLKFYSSLRLNARDKLATLKHRPFNEE